MVGAHGAVVGTHGAVVGSHGAVVGSHKQGNELSGSIKCREFVDS